MFNPERVRLVTNPFRVQSFLFIYLPRVLAGSNPGLQLANAFGVEADVFEMPNWHLKI